MVEHGTVWYSMVEHGTVWYNMVEHGTVWYNIVEHGMVWYSMVEHGTVWYSMVEHGTVWYNMAKHVTVWYQEFITVMNSRWYIKVSVHGTLWYDSGKLLREKIFVIRGKFGDMASFGGIISGTSNLQKFSARKFYFPPIRKSFLPQKFPAIRYSGMVWYKLWYGDVYTLHSCC